MWLHIYLLQFGVFMGCIEELTFTVSIIYSYIGTTSSSTSIMYSLYTTYIYIYVRSYVPCLDESSGDGLTEGAGFW